MIFKFYVNNNIGKLNHVFHLLKYVISSNDLSPFLIVFSSIYSDIYNQPL